MSTHQVLLRKPHNVVQKVVVRSGTATWGVPSSECIALNWETATTLSLHHLIFMGVYNDGQNVQNCGQNDSDDDLNVYNDGNDDRNNDDNGVKNAHHDD